MRARKFGRRVDISIHEDGFEAIATAALAIAGPWLYDQLEAQHFDTVDLQIQYVPSTTNSTLHMCSTFIHSVKKVYKNGTGHCTSPHESILAPLHYGTKPSPHHYSPSYAPNHRLKSS